MVNEVCIPTRERGNEVKKSCVPKLRFSEFRDAGEWVETTLGESVKFLDGQRKPIKESDRAMMQGEYPYYGASGIIDYVNDYIFDEDLILLGEDGENIVSRNLPLVFKVTGKCWVNNHAHVLIPKKMHHLDFLVQYMESLSYIKYNSGGAQPKLNQAVCKAIPLILPLPKEQQKIADCLSSIDELITAHSQKHDALKAHKKGLMQQLFPATGDDCMDTGGRATQDAKAGTIPKLRFPEFRGAGEWDVKILDQLTSRIGDGIHSTPKYNANGNYYFINGNNLVDGKISISESTKRVDEVEAKNHSRDLSNRTILLSINGTIGNLAFYNSEKVMLGKSAAYINLKNNVDLGFIYNTLKTSKTHSFFVSELTGSTIKNLSLKTIRETKISIPTPSEQKKIADCLSSVDDLITAQAKKIDSLKAHKKGLMQQLFPPVDEVNG